MSRKYFILCLLCAIWTILQTSFHLVFVVYTYFLGICKQKATDAPSILFYLTYLYNKNCGTPELQHSAIEGSRSNFVFQLINTIYGDSNTTLNMEELVKTLLKDIDAFPDSAESSARTSVFLLCFLILDGAWIVSAVSLLMGTAFGIKEQLSLVFYGPWLVMTICMSVFDATSSVLFGFDISETLSFSGWLKFVGISDTSPFPDYDSLGMPQFLTTAPSLAICSVSSRFVLIWISNWICFVFVTKATISVYKESYKTEPSSVESAPDLDTSAARIRNWQLFYGAIDATSTLSSTKSAESEKDNLKSNSKEGVEDLVSPTVGNYFAYPDVAESMGAARYVSPELRGQLPWSYMRPPEAAPAGQVMELERRHARIKSDSSGSGTEL